MKYVRFLLAFLCFAASPVFAQWQVPQYAVPTGRGGGAMGFDSAAPGVVGSALVSQGPSGIKPIFRQLTPADLLPTIISITGATTTYNATTQTGNYVEQSNSGLPMVGTLPSGGSIIPAGKFINIKNVDASGVLVVVAAGGATLNGSASGYVPLGPSESVQIYSDGVNAYKSFGAPSRAKINPLGLGTVTGSVSGTTFTAASGLSGTLAVGQMIGGGTLRRGTTIVAQLTGASGGLGTYQISSSQTVASASIAFGFPMVLYFATSGGADTNYGTVPNAPFATPQGAINALMSRYDLSAAFFVVRACQSSASTCGPPSVPQTINGGFLVRGRPPGLGNSAGYDPFYHAILIIGDPNNVANYTITGSAPCAQAIQGSFFIDGFTLNCAGGGVGAGSQSVVGIGTVAYGATSGNDISADQSQIHFDDSYTKTGAASCHKLVRNGGNIINNGAVTATVTAGAWSTGSICFQSYGTINDVGLTYSGTATGPKFNAGPFGGAYNISIGVDPNTLLLGSSPGVYDLRGPANGVDGPGQFSAVTVTGLGAVSFVTTDTNKALSTFPTANSGVLVTSGVGAPSISSTLPNGLAMGTPNSLTLTNATGLPISTGLTGAGAGCIAWLATPTSANLRGCLTDETGTGLLYFQGGALGTPSSATLTNATGLPLATGITGFGTGIATALGVNIRTAGAPALLGSVSASQFLTTDTNKDISGFATCNNGSIQTNGSGTPTCATLSVTTNTLNADVAMNVANTYFNGPSVSIGTGIWWVAGTVTINDPSGAVRIDCKLYDTTGGGIIASAENATQGIAAGGQVSLAGPVTSPAGNIAIACKELVSTTGLIKFNMSGNSKDSTLSAYRIGTP